MRHPQIVVYERDGRLAQQLRPLAEARRWPLREPRQPDACRRLIEKPGPAVLVVRLGRDPEQELALLSHAASRHEVRTVAVGESEDAVALITLAWDLGSDFVLAPPISREILPAVVAGLIDGRRLIAAGRS